MPLTRLIFSLLICLSLPVAAQTPAKPPMIAPTAIASGAYLGLKPIESIEPLQPDAQSFHANFLVLRDGEVIVDALPLSIQQGKKRYSASDGGFLTYRGRILGRNGHVYLSLRMFRSDYAFFPLGKNACEPYSQIEILPIKITSDGFWLKGVLYKKLAADSDFLKDLPVEGDYLKGLEEELKTEPYEYNGKHPYSTKHKMDACPAYDLSNIDLEELSVSAPTD